MSKKTDKRSFSPQLKKTLTLVLPVAAGGVIVDQLTKIWAASCKIICRLKSFPASSACIMQKTPERLSAC